MFIPPGALESSGHEYRSEQSVPRADPPMPNQPSVSTRREPKIWPVKQFQAKPESWLLIILYLAFSALMLWGVCAELLSNNVREIRQGLFAGPIISILAIWSIRSLYRRIVFQPTCIILETDRLIYDRGHAQSPKMIQYEQIFQVAMPTKEAMSFISRERQEVARERISVSYYPYDEFTGAPNLARLRTLTLPETDSDFSLRDELRQRAYGPTPSRQARARSLIEGLGRLALILLAMVLYLMFVGILQVIFT